MIREIVLFIFLFLVFQKGNSQETFVFKDGDLLFQTGKGSEFENAITLSTAKIEDFSFSHVGVLSFENDSVFVLEASSESGVSKIFINDFMKKSSVTVVGRLKPQYGYVIPEAIKNIKLLVGKPYDFVYLKDNDAYYCSELIQVTFKLNDGTSIFETIPMTFKNKNTGEILEFWTEHYKRHNEKIPEGKPGTNPVQLSKSDKIELVKIISGDL